jgi:hypothetical protein
MYWFQRWFEKIVEAVRSEAGATNDALKEQIDSIRIDRDTAKSEQNEAARIVADAINSASNTASNYEHPQRRKEYRLQVFLVVFTVLAALGAVSAAVGSWYALPAIKESADAAKTSAYAACKAAQIAQRNLLEAQNSNAISQTIAIDTAMEAGAGIAGQRAEMNIIPSLALPGEVDHWDQYRVFHNIVNDGKSPADNVRITVTAKLFQNDEPLRLSQDRKTSHLLGFMHFPAGGKVPADKNGNPTRVATLTVFDSKGNRVVLSQPELANVLEDRAFIAVFGKITYSDFAGSYRTNFCRPLYGIPPGAFHNDTASEIECIKANKYFNKYRYTTPAALPKAMPAEEIKCEVPKD